MALAADTGCFALTVLRNLNQHGQRSIGVRPSELLEGQLLLGSCIVPASAGASGAGTFAAPSRHLISL
jgi:hypothetical protein